MQGGGNGFNFGSLGNILNGGLGLYNLISGINANNQIGSGLANVGNQYSNLLGAIGNQYLGTGIPLTNQLAGLGSNLTTGLGSFLSGNLSSLLNSSMNPLGPSGAASAYTSAIQPWMNAISGNITGTGQNLANNAAQQFAINQGQNLTGAGGPQNAANSILSQIPGAIAQGEQATLPGLQSAFSQGLQAQYNAPGNTVGLIQSLLGQPNQTANLLNVIPGLSFQGLGGLSNLLTNQQQNNAQNQAGAYAQQQSGGGGGGFLNFLGPIGGLLSGIGSIFGL
jgi:hypothetical protein